MAPTRARLQLSPWRRLRELPGELGLWFALPGASAAKSRRPKAGQAALSTVLTVVHVDSQF